MEEINMAREKRSKHSKELAKLILEEYQPKSLEDMDNALKDIFGPMIEGMLKGEMDHHLGYKSNDKGSKENDNRRNGYGKKTIKTTKGEVTIFQETGMLRLIQSSSKNTKEIYLLLKERS